MKARTPPPSARRPALASAHGLLLAAVACATVACSSGSTGDGAVLDRIQQPSLCGDDDMQDVESYDGSLGPSTAFVAARQGPVGNLKWRSDLSSRYTNAGNVNGARWCTGTLISADLVLTAGHCFDQDINGWTWPRVNGTSTPISSAVGATEMQVDFNYQDDPSGNPRTPTTYDVSSLVEYRLGSLDFAVIQLSSAAGNTFGHTAPSAFALNVGSDVTLIQHPNGQPKKIHAGSVSSLSGSNVYYSTADTLGGSSGSGVLSELSGLIMAVHTNAGCNGDGSGANRGVAISSILASSPTVARRAIDSAKLASLALL